MTLLELLRQELPKRGGWPEGEGFISQDSKTCATPGNVYAYATKPVSHGDYWINDDCTSGYGVLIFKTNIIADDSTTAIVTREQYEATGWDGTDLPPVGCDVEYSWAGEPWVSGVIRYISKHTIIIETQADSTGDTECAYHPTDIKLRPLRTEAERAIDEMVRLSGVSTGAAKILYDAGYRKG